MIKIPGTICLFLLYLTAHAQKLPNTLLWRISGNGLQKPSYLYGTMHLADERLFNLGDSLYSAIENSEGFAIEASPEDMTAYLINEINDRFNNSKRIKSILNEKVFEKYSQALSKRLKKPADEVTTKDIFLEKNKWVEERFRKGKMSTFLDAYLYDVARRLGKWTGGIEDLEDHKGLLDELIDESDIRQLATEDKVNSDKAADSFIKLYISSDLNIIDSLSRSADSTYMDALLIKRNYKMARRIDSLGRIRNTVFAIGAAHLPGREGLIRLLQKRGYEVLPVFFSKKVKPENYKVKQLDIPWITVNDPDSFYRIDMPGRPGDILMYGLLKMKMNYDVFNNTGYMVSAITIPYDQKGVDSILSFYAKNIFNGKSAQQEKNIVINGITGKELESTGEDGYKHGYVLSKGHVIYLAIGFAVKKDAKSMNALKKFLSSYQVFERKGRDAYEAYTHTDTAGLFKVDLPSKPQPADNLVNRETDKSVKSRLMVSFDKQTGAYFFFSTNETAAGYFIENDSTTLNNIADNTRAKFSSVYIDTTYCDATKRFLKLEGKMVNTNIHARTLYVITGNRWYGLLAMYDSSKSLTSVDRFFRSFTVLEAPRAEWKLQTTEDSSISAWLPGSIKHYPSEDTAAYRFKYEVYDSAHANNYDIIVSTFGKYYWQNTDSALWDALKRRNVNQSEVLSQRAVANGTIKGIDFSSRQQGALNVKRQRALLYGDQLYTLITVQPAHSIGDSNVNKFFEEFRFNRPPPPSTIFTSKAAQLLNDLSAEDSAVKAGALQSLAGANFDVRDLELLYQSLLKTYPVTNDDYSVNYNLAQVIASIKDSLSLRLAKEKYNLTNNKEIKNLLLDIISGYKTRENYKDLEKLLVNFPPDTVLSRTFINNVKDSPALAVFFIRNVFPLLKDTNLVPAIVSISLRLIDSNLISLSELLPHLQHILDFAGSRYQYLATHAEDYDNTDVATVYMLGKLNTVQGNALLQKWALIDNSYLRFRCVEALLHNGQVNARAINRLVKDRYWRIDIYTLLKKQNKRYLFPKEFLSQQYFAESMAYAEAAAGDDEPSSFTFLRQKIVIFRGKKARFFFYKAGYDNDNAFKLCAAGPFAPDPLNLSVDDAYGSVYSDKDLDAADLENQMKKLIELMQNPD